MSKTYETDILIIGSGVSALTLGALLKRSNIPFLIVDQLDQIGGRARSLETHDTTIDFGMKSFPVGQNIHANPILKIKELLGLEFGIEPWTEGPAQFEKGEWKSFLGFGETLQTKQAEELLYYSESPRLMVSGGFGKLISQLTQLIPQKSILLKSQVTQIKADGDILNEVVINGSDTIKFKRLVATIAPLDLISLMPPNLLSQKTLMPLITRKLFPQALASISFQKIGPSPEKMFCIYLKQPKDPTICCGYFTSNIDPLRISSTSSSSSWLTLIDPEDGTDDEKVSKQIRVMKRLITRAFPKLLESVTWERIIVQPNALGLIPVFQLEKNGSIPGVENLFVAGSIYARGAQSGLRNAPAAIESALVLAQNLGAELEAHIQLGSTKSEEPQLTTL